MDADARAAGRAASPEQRDRETTIASRSLMPLEAACVNPRRAGKTPAMSEPVVSFERDRAEALARIA